MTLHHKNGVCGLVVIPLAINFFFFSRQNWLHVSAHANFLNEIQQ